MEFCRATDLTRQQRRHYKGAFTLVELLVVISIIALLAALLLPTLTSARQHAHSANCISNLRQIGIALQIYVQENGYYPLATAGNGLGEWQRALCPVTLENVLYCPQLTQASDEFLQFFPSNNLIFPHYGYNATGAVRRNPPPRNPGLGGDFMYDPTGSNVFSIGASTSTNYIFADTGIYTAVVHAGNYIGTGSYSLDLTVFGGCASLPTVSVTPTNLVAISGSPATFTAVASGPTPLYYQWRFGASPISGATNTTYSIARMHTNNVGAYMVVVSNPGGAVTSAPPALLSITGPHVSVIKSGANDIILWPTNYAAGFTLQTTTNLAAGTWVTVTNPFTTVGTNIVFTNIISGKSAFFRLVQ